MKKLLLLILVSCAANLRCDDLSDAIRESNLEKVRSILDQGKITLGEGNKYLVIAAESLHLRQQQLLLGSPTTKTIPSPLTMGAVATGLGTVYSMFFLKNLFGYRSNYEFGFCLALKTAARVAISIGGAVAVTHWYRKKVKILEDNYNSAALICELLYDRAKDKESAGTIPRSK